LNRRSRPSELINRCYIFFITKNRRSRKYEADSSQIKKQNNFYFLILLYVPHIIHARIYDITPLNKNVTIVKDSISIIGINFRPIINEPENKELQGGQWVGGGLHIAQLKPVSKLIGKSNKIINVRIIFLSLILKNSFRSII
jgi:hypothetical protein